MVVSGKQELITQAYSKGAVKPLTGGQEAVSSSLATRTIFRKAEIVDIQRFQLFSFLLFLLFGHYLDIILEKTGFSAYFKRFCEQKQDITQSSFHCRVMSLFNFKYLCD